MQNNLDFLDYLNDDGEVNLDQINSFLDKVEKVEDLNDEKGSEGLENLDDDSGSEGTEDFSQQNLPFIDGLEYLNRKSTPKGEIDSTDEGSQDDNNDGSDSNLEGNSDDSDDSDDSGESTEEGDENPFAIFAKGLAKIGRLVLDENEDPEKIEWNEETFIEKFDETVENSAWSRLEELATETMGEEGVRVIEDLFINKVPVRDYLASYQQQQSIENIDISTERNQVEIVKYYLRSVVGETDEEEIMDQIQYMKANDLLEKKATNFQHKLIANESKMREAMAAEAQARQKQMEEFEAQRIKTYSEVAQKAVKEGELNGIPFNNKDYQKVLNSALNKEYVLPNGQKITPFEYKLATLRKDDPAKYLQVVKLVEDGLDLTPVMKKGVTTKTNEIFQGLQDKTKTSSKPKTSKKNVFKTYLQQL